MVGKRIAEIAQEKGIQQVAFDRGGYLYHGRIRALAEGRARRRTSVLGSVLVSSVRASARTNRPAAAPALQ